MPPRLVIASLLEHITLFGLKTTLTTVSSAIPASNTFASLASNWLSPTMTSTPVVLRVSSSQGFLSLICCLSSLPVISGVTSRTRISPLGCSAEIRCIAMAPRPLADSIAEPSWPGLSWWQDRCSETICFPKSIPKLAFRRLLVADSSVIIALCLANYVNNWMYIIGTPTECRRRRVSNVTGAKRLIEKTACDDSSIGLFCLVGSEVPTSRQHEQHLQNLPGSDPTGSSLSYPVLGLNYPTRVFHDSLYFHADLPVNTPDPTEPSRFAAHAAAPPRIEKGPFLGSMRFAPADRDGASAPLSEAVRPQREPEVQ